MLRALFNVASRRQALRHSCSVLHGVKLLPEEGTDSNQALLATCTLTAAPWSDPRPELQQAVSRTAPKPGCPQGPAPTRLHEQFPSSTPAYISSGRSSSPLSVAESAWRQSLKLVQPAQFRVSVASLTCSHGVCQHQQLRTSSSAAAASKSKARRGPKKASDPAAAARARTPEWALMPSQLDALPAAMRRRSARLSALQSQLKAEAAKAEAGGWAASSKVAAAEAAARALPIPPKDFGASELATALEPGTSFEAAHAAMIQLCRRGVCLDAEHHLSPLLHKASAAAHLYSGLELLRTAHLVRAAVQPGAHGAVHDVLHGVLAEKCTRLHTAAPLVELWDSLYEHGMTPSKAAGRAAVKAAVALRDGRAAAALLSLTSLYSQEPLAGESEARAVLELLGAEIPEEAARVRQLLPRLGFRTTA